MKLGAAKNINLNKYVEVFEDESGKLTFDDVMRDQDGFRPFMAEGRYWEKGFTRSAFWFRVKVFNASLETDWHIHLHSPLSRSVVVYMASDEGRAANDFKVLKPIPHARNINYYLHLLPDSKHLIYYRVQDTQMSLGIEAKLSASTSFTRQFVRDLPLASFIVGGLFLLVVYNFLYFIFLRDWSFLSISVL
ncbi:MAG: 7TMR-DISMED2 domain-containing protein, partial [Thiolinea sp.]